MPVGHYELVSLNADSDPPSPTRAPVRALAPPGAGRNFAPVTLCSEYRVVVVPVTSPYRTAHLSTNADPGVRQRGLPPQRDPVQTARLRLATLGR